MQDFQELSPRGIAVEALDVAFRLCLSYSFDSACTGWRGAARLTIHLKFIRAADFLNHASAEGGGEQYTARDGERPRELPAAGGHSVPESVARQLTDARW